MSVQAIAWSPSGAVRIVDQRALPEARIERDLEGAEAVADAIRTLQVRGAPLIGIAAAMGLVAELRRERGAPRAEFLARVAELVPVLAATRPTAANLRWALNRMARVATEAAGDGAGLWERLHAEATAIWEEDRAMCRRIVEAGLPLVPDGTKVLTHCNAGALATDRIAANGAFANKIGTYPLAVLARHHGVPFYCAAPSSTIDCALADGDGIPIEQRPAEEVKTLAGRRIAPAAAAAFNPAFDVTPARYVTGFLTDRGLAQPPFRDAGRA